MSSAAAAAMEAGRTALQEAGGNEEGSAEFNKVCAEGAAIQVAKVREKRLEALKAALRRYKAPQEHETISEREERNRWVRNGHRSVSLLTGVSERSPRNSTESVWPL